MLGPRLIMSGLNVTTMGPASAPRVMCLHGFLGSGADWIPLAGSCGDRFRFDLVDLPGHGKSTRLPPGDYAFAACARELSERAAGAFALIGYSMGGRLALAVAAQGIPGLRALIIISATPGIEDRSALDSRRIEDYARAQRLESEGLSAFLEGWYEQPLFSSLAQRPDLREDLIRRRAQGAASELAKALRGLSVSVQESFWPSLGGLTVPSLWIAGEEDARYAAIAKRAASLSGNGRARIVPLCGHLPHVEQAETTKAEIIQFLEQQRER